MSVLGPEHVELMLRRSAKSYAERCSRVSQDNTVNYLNGEVEFSAATPALLALVCTWSATTSSKETAAAQKKQASKFLELFLGKVFGDVVFDFVTDGVRLAITCGSLYVSGLRNQFAPLRKSPVFKPYHMRVHSVMINLAYFLQKSAKASEKLCDACLRCLRLLSRFIAELVEYRAEKAKGDCWDKHAGAQDLCLILPLVHKLFSHTFRTHVFGKGSPCL